MNKEQFKKSMQTIKKYIDTNKSGRNSSSDIEWDNAINAIDGIRIWVGTQSEYDAIGSKSNTTIYMIKEQ